MNKYWLLGLFLYFGSAEAYNSPGYGEKIDSLEPQKNFIDDYSFQPYVCCELVVPGVGIAVRHLDRFGKSEFNFKLGSLLVQYYSLSASKLLKLRSWST
ncbi:MAG: hypothetical protein S4CHLAM20_00570 [Chlamydiia bacterium]|nr:hypothetical protein [Chlamydiia bacterium]